MDGSKYDYLNVTKSLLEKELNKSYESFDKLKVNSDLFDEIYERILVAANSLSWPILDKTTFESYFNSARKEVLANNPITIAPPHSLSKKKSTWLNNEKSTQIHWNYTNRYLKYLKGKGRATSVVDRIESSSFRILEKLADPKAMNEVFVKGLVDGDVQAGKTENFNAVINRAVDAGYRLIIVLSGIMDDLRKQTQKRIDQDIIGEGGEGVGKIRAFGHHGDESVTQVISITSEAKDFDRPVAESNHSLNHQNIMVCKKNVSILKNILLWLHDNLPEGTSKYNLPLLIIDDEADNASLNNEGYKGEEYASKINGHIRAILGLFHKKSYLGYTATPFANVIQDRNIAPEKKWSIWDKSEEKLFDQEDNLFPDDFIFLLDSPTNYIGAHRVFESLQSTKKIPAVFPIDDYIDDFPSRVTKDEVKGVERFDTKQEWEQKVGKFGHYLGFTSFKDYKSETRAAKTVDEFPKKIPDSLKRAVMSFILSIAVRELRRKELILSPLYQRHNTMLIHISRFTAWQNRTASYLKEYCEEIKVKLATDKASAADSIYKTFESVWNDYYAEIVGAINNYLPTGYVDDFMTPVSFNALNLCDAVKGIEVLALNSDSEQELKYDDEIDRRVIAIGGNRLSRGFTLEGLTTSYFVRTTNFSDSLLQMGRWFGYRTGYLDCCKLFTTLDLINKYDSTTLCIDELKEEFRVMEEKNATPREFELRVRQHPGRFQITRRSILKNATSVKWSYQDSLQMTTEFDVSKSKLSSVWNDFRSTISPMFQGAIKKGGNDSLLAASVSAAEILEILSLNNNFDESRNTLLKQYIEKCVEKNLLTSWTLAIKVTGNATKDGLGPLESEETGLPESVQLAIRTGPENTKGNIFYTQFVSQQTFKASGGSANIMSAGTDFSVALENSSILKAESRFLEQKTAEIMKEHPDLSKALAMEQAKKRSKPERIYREQLSCSEGVLVIYLFDPYYVFRQVKGDINDEITQLLNKRGQELKEPLVGLAIGFPQISRDKDPGGEYVKGDYELNELVEGEDESETNQLPEDAEV